MDFDYHSKYEEYSNVELLKILLQKELFQEAAVKAAEGVLASRNVTNDEWAAAAAFIIGISKANSLKEKRREKISNSVNSRLRMFLFPANNTIGQHIKVFSVVYLLLWLYGSIRIFRELFMLLSYKLDLWTIIILLLQLSYLLIVYWLYRLDRKGLVLLFIYTSFSAGFLIEEFYKWFASNFKLYRITGGTFTVILTYVFIFYFFNRKDVLEVLRISRRLQSSLLVISAILFLIAAFQDFLGLSYIFG